MQDLRSDRLRRHRATCAIGVMWCVVSSCGRDAERAPTSPTSNTAVAATVIDVDQMLSLESRITDANVGAHGTCLATGQRLDRSRLLYLLLPEESGYLRLNVVSSATGATIEMLDLVRGLPSGGQWSATQLRADDRVVTRTFTSISDHAPLIGSLEANSAQTSRLRRVAAVALTLACPTSP